MRQDTLEYHVLGCVCDDYEAPHTIAGDLTRILERAVSDEEVLTALLGLEQNGLVQAFVFDSTMQRFLPVKGEVASTEADPWFMATAKGLQESVNHPSE